MPERELNLRIALHNLRIREADKQQQLAARKPRRRI